MSYTKMQKEIEKLLKSRQDFDADRLIAYRQARDIIFARWIEEKLYKELVSVAHAGWFIESDFLEPLAEHFTKEHELAYLRFLCERKIRFDIEDLLYLMKYYEDDIKQDDIADILTVNISHRIEDIFIRYDKDKDLEKPAWEIAKQRYWALFRIDRYIGYLGEFDNEDLQKQVEAVRRKVSDLSVRKKDLSVFKYKIPTE